MFRILFLMIVLASPHAILTGCDALDDDDDNGSGNANGNGNGGERQLDTAYDPTVLPQNFVDSISNPYWPMQPGRSFAFGDPEGDTLDGDDTLDTGDTTVADSGVSDLVGVLAEKKEILGISCTVVRDREYEDGELVEETFDWYAQDKGGNVWYFGEDTREMEDGQVVSTEGSWQAGVEGAKPGIIMWANPQPGPPYRQEYFFNHAEDWAQVVEILDSLEIGLGTFKSVVKIKEWNDLEPDVLEYKYYAPDLGLIREEEVRPDSAEVELKSIVGP